MIEDFLLGEALLCKLSKPIVFDKMVKKIENINKKNKKRFDKVYVMVYYQYRCSEQKVLRNKHARVAQLVERDLAKVEAAGSSPVSRSFLFLRFKRLPRVRKPLFPCLCCISCCVIFNHFTGRKT